MSTYDADNLQRAARDAEVCEYIVKENLLDLLAVLGIAELAEIN